jgi:hypothetical protein
MQKKKKKKSNYTPLGEIDLIGRGYSTPNGVKFKVDEELGLPSKKWLPQVLELACALGVTSEFPKSIEILDFYHLSEYVWKVAKKAYAQCEIKQKEWVNKQQKLLKESSWQTVINNCGKIKRKNQELSEELIGIINGNQNKQFLSQKKVKPLVISI